MKNILPLFVLAFLLFCGCSAGNDHNYIGMTKEEVALHLEKHAFRDRWSRNRFEIMVPKQYKGDHYFSNAQEILRRKAVMSADEWSCDFFPQRHWLLGWNGLFARWTLWKLFFKDGKVVRQQRMGNYYWVYGHAGVSPYPQFPGNFHKVNDKLYRSSQPDEDEFESLHTFNGIRSVLNLREYFSDRDEIAAVNRKRKGALTLYEIPLDTGKISEADLYKILKVVRDAPKPLLIHCWHGSDRTGCAIAASRIVFENWSVEKAISELMKPEYGHHKNIYTNIPALLRKADWKKIKSAILNNK